MREILNTDMSKVAVAQGNDPVSAIREVIDDLGSVFVDLAKSAKSICIVSTASDEATQAVIDALGFHGRAPIHVLNADDEGDSVEVSIPRGEDLRSPIRRPRSIIGADVVIVIVPMLADRNRRTLLTIEQFCFSTWYVPERRTVHGFVRSHEPWLEGDLRDIVLADLYTQRPITLAIIDGTATSSIALASFDAIALDAVAMHMNGIDPESVGYLSTLSQQGLGVCALSKIDIPLGMISR